MDTRTSHPHLYSEPCDHHDPPGFEYGLCITFIHQHAYCYKYIHIYYYLHQYLRQYICGNISSDENSNKDEGRHSNGFTDALPGLHLRNYRGGR